LEAVLSYKIDEIEGIGPAYSAKLQEAGIKTTDDLLDNCGSGKGRKDTAEKTGLSASQLLKWANMADLMRISGVGEEYSELLEAAGVDTVKELKHRNAANLAAKMAEVNEAKNLTRRAPSQSEVEKWVEQAKGMEPRISH
jgi:predicted flap endonuclease-1-like 5' DNA nuclease